MKEGLESAENQESNVYEHRAEYSAGNSSAVLGGLLRAHHGVVACLEQGPDDAEDDDGEAGHDNARI